MMLNSNPDSDSSDNELLHPHEWMEAGRDLDAAEQLFEEEWGGSDKSAVWGGATYDEVQDTWTDLLKRHVHEVRWGPSAEECCWETDLKAGEAGYPTKEIKRKRYRRTKAEIAKGMKRRKQTPRLRPYCTHIALRATGRFPLPHKGG